MHDILYENQTKPKLEDFYLLSYVRRLGLDTEKFEELLRNPKYITKIKKDKRGELKSDFNNKHIFNINGMKYSGDYTEITEILAYIQALKSNYFRLS